MGRLLLVWRLAVRDLRRRPGEAAIFLVAVTATTAALALGLAAGTAVTAGYQKTREATAGPDLTAITTAADPAGLAARLAAAPGVAELAPPVFAFDATVGLNGRAAHTSIEGRDTRPSTVDRPLVTDGAWVRPGGAVVERGFARMFGVGVGDVVSLGGRGYPVVGIAISAATPVYPWSDWAQGAGPTDRGGRIWLTTADARAAAGDAEVVYLIHLKLTDPDLPVHWRETVFTDDRRGDDWVNTHTWQTVLQTDRNMIRNTQPDLVIGGWLLAAAAFVTLAALAAVRAGRDNRRAGLLKAVGAGPRTVAAVLLAQYLAPTALAAALGLTVGTVAAPALADPSAGLLTTAGPPAPFTVVAVVLLAVLVTLAGTLGPVLRAARTSTVHTLADPARLFTHQPRLTALTAYLPTSFLIGVRLLARRPGRAALTVLGIATISVTIAALLAYRTALATDKGTGLTAPAMAAVNARTDQVLLGITLALAALSALNTVFLGWSTAIQARRALAVTRTLGATPGQVVLALCTAQLVPAVPALLLGMPAGLGLYGMLSGRAAVPAGWWLPVAGAVIMAAVGVLTAVPAWLHTRQPAGRALTT
ncbi:FtsX-like permease family protein [Amycolatopsis sp. OK19-0408]|uniref:FtsX-like permease family protein n=1 Tax=Amycolatopsis iheyensis TaxID=2945988 RepID=A0A9X2NEY9_9PSEU|nr:FtsX-like permease family protein [Amycolatopsis iheyensis]MCR6487469.1 FtsX-like permease family protein [Amycolatopsis iheyensis]